MADVPFKTIDRDGLPVSLPTAQAIVDVLSAPKTCGIAIALTGSSSSSASFGTGFVSQICEDCILFNDDTSAGGSTPVEFCLDGAQGATIAIALGGSVPVFNVGNLSRITARRVDQGGSSSYRVKLKALWFGKVPA